MKTQAAPPGVAPSFPTSHRSKSRLRPGPIVALAFAVLCAGARADIVAPFVADPFTLHLWHLDETTTPAADEGSGALPLSAASNGATLGNPAFTGFGNAVSTFDGGQNGVTAADKDAYLAPLTLVNSANDNVAWSFADPATGAFTFECLVRIDFDPAANLGTTANGGNNRNAPLQLITGDQDSSGGGVRSWQFRLDPVGLNPNAGGITTPLIQPALEFINIGPPAQFIFASIPTNGPEAIVPGQWYHVAVTYNGDANVADNFKVYWTRVDASRTQASLLVSARLTNDLPVGPVDFANGNTGRGTPNGNFLGLIDEVRISSVARAADQMLFGSAGLPPEFTLQPQSQFVAAGDDVTLTALASGSQPISYQWQREEADLAGETSPTLTLTNISTAEAGEYRVIATNAAGSATSAVARITIGVRLNEIFGTGTDDDHLLLPGGSVDPHYRLVVSEDFDYPGPAAMVLNDVTPIPPYAANGPDSKWIGPRLNTPGFAGNVQGLYVYRTEFVIDSVELTNAVVQGRWGSDNDGFDLRLNGASLGLRRLVDRAFETLAPFTISNGLRVGLNTFELAVSNRPPMGATALRVDLSGLGFPLPPGLPQITHQPENRLFVETDTAVLSVVAWGAPPLSYQWLREGNPVPGQTHRTLRLPGATLGDSGNYQVVVSNESGSVTSEVAALTIEVNDPPLANADGLVTALLTPISFSITRLLANDTDPEGNFVFVTMVDSATVLGGTVMRTNRTLTYTPPISGFPDDLDSFNYTISDGFGGTASGSVQVRLLEGLVPTENRVVITRTLDGYRLRYFGDSMRSYHVQRAPSVTGSWSTLSTVTSSLHGLVEYEDTAPLPGMAFYRVLAP